MRVDGSNVGRIAERIAMNELEARDFHIIDLAYMSKTSANVDFIASKGGVSYNIQVKGASAPSGRIWGIHYGYCDEEMIRDRGKKVFNRSGFALEAQIVVLIAVHSPNQYRSIIMPVEVAERSVQINLDRYYRKTKLDGGVRKPNKIFCNFDGVKKRLVDPLFEEERNLLLAHEGAWEPLGVPLVREVISPG